MEVDWSEFGTKSSSVVLDPEAPIPFDTREWRSWSIIEMTRNYVSLMLNYLASNEGGGMLVHCISGWDRTPLYISLLRISLWADGVAHQTLSARELLYLTVMYDWALFRHHLVNRTTNGEDIFYFCFFVLPFLSDSTFSMEQVKRTMANQTHQCSSKISIDRPSNSEEDDSFIGSFGSCGKSWEITGAYLNQFASRSLSNGSSFAAESPPKRSISHTRQDSNHSIDSGGSDSEDFGGCSSEGLMTFEFEDDDILVSSNGALPLTVLSPPTTDSTPSNTSPKCNENQSQSSEEVGGLSVRARRLWEVRRLMLSLYSSHGPKP